MELKQIIKRLKVYRTHIVFSMLIGVIIGTVVATRPSKYIASGSFYIKRSIETGQGNYFKYEGYYSQKTAQDYSNTIVALLESVDLKSKSLTDLQIEVNDANIKKLKRAMIIKKPGPQLITLEVKNKDPVGAENIWNSLSTNLVETARELNLSSDPNLGVEIVSLEPIVRQNYRPFGLYPIVGALLGLNMCILVISTKEYLS